MRELNFENNELATSYPKKILVVEDDLSMQPIMDRILRSLRPQVEVFWCANAELSEEALSLDHFDLIISDYFLNGSKTGLDLWSHCSKKYPSIPFILMTGLDIDQVFRMLDRETNVPVLLPKPFRPERCQEMIEALMQ